MVTKISGGKLVLPEGIVEGKSIYYENGTILAVTEEELPFDCEKKANGNYVSAGFIDIHVHGGFGVRFEDATEEEVIKACDGHFAHGTTAIYPTLSSSTIEDMEKAAALVRKVKEDKSTKAEIVGIHLEGPYFSPLQCGAQDPNHIRRPQKEEYIKFLDEYSDIIKRWSYAPEVDPDLEFLHTLTDYNVMASAAHTDALYTEMMKAYNSGMKMITHFYSCTSTVTRKGGFRFPGVLEAGYLTDGITVEAITDGCHLPPELIRLIHKVKGTEKMCLVTDSVRYGGMENEADGIEDDHCLVEDGVAKLKDRSAFAGSIATTDRLVRTCVKMAGIPLVDAVKMVTQTPAEAMNLDKKGKIMYGYDAEFVIFDEDINVVEVIRQSK